MKKILIPVILILMLLTGCSSEPDYVDTGQPGTIRVVVFNDQNRNEFKDEGEPIGGELVGISQDAACPSGNTEKTNTMETNTEGEAIFKDLTPGKYCVMYMDDGFATTKLTYEVFLSSDELLSIGFGILRD